MRLKVISPVIQSEAERKEEESYIQSLVRPSVQIELENLRFGFPSIESALSCTVNSGELVVELLRQDITGIDGIFINCFDDPGVSACREALKIPVCGGYVPSMLTAMFLGERVGIITTDPCCIEIEERKARENSFSKLVAVGCVQTQVVDLLMDPNRLVNDLANECERLRAKSRVDTVCLGCTVMSQVWQALRNELERRNCPVHVVEPLTTGLYWLENMVSLKYTNSLSLGFGLDGLHWR